MYRDSGQSDKVEVLYSIPTLTVRRFRMNQTDGLNSLETGLSEAILVVTQGAAELQEESKSNVFRMGSQDFCYLPPGDRFSVRKASEKCEILWASAPATGKFEPYSKKHADCQLTESGSRDNGTHRVSTRMINRFDR